MLNHCRGKPFIGVLAEGACEKTNQSSMDSPRFCRPFLHLVGPRDDASRQDPKSQFYFSRTSHKPVERPPLTAHFLEE